MIHFLPTTKWNTLDQLQFSTETEYMEYFIIIFNMLGSLDKVFFLNNIVTKGHAHKNFCCE